MDLEGSLGDLAVEEPYRGVSRRSFDGEKATVNEYTFSPSAAFPLHRHSQEQITLVLEGTIDLTVEGRHVSLQGGGWSIVGGGRVHGIRAGAEGARILAILIPRREAPDAYTVLG